MPQGDRTSLVGLAKPLKRAGLDLRKIDGWAQRGASGLFTPIAALHHHTASSKLGGNLPSLGICTNGRAGIPGPLCNILVGRNGLVVLIAALRANHGGLGGPCRGIPKDSANRYAVGVEVENDGVGEEWDKNLREVMDVLFAEILDFLEVDRGDHDRKTFIGAGRLMGHKEYTSRKIDPANFSMPHERDRVRKLLRSAA